MKGCEPSLVDVILTNKNNLCFKTLNFNTGVSDCHHMISTFIKGNIPNCVNSKIQYRSFKDFDVNKYISDIDNTVYLHDSSECVDDINTMYNDFETKVSQVIDRHAPIKYRYPRKNSVPYMNREPRKAIYQKQMLRSKFEKYKTNKTWEAYRKQRNLVTKLKRKSVHTYFQERCTGGQKSKTCLHHSQAISIKKQKNLKVVNRKLY
jgi:ERCC4-related helicase